MSASKTVHVTSETITVPISSIISREGNSRTAKNPEFETIKASMADPEIGLLQPVSVRRLSGENGSSAFHLIAGNTRLDAAIKLGWKEIRATVVTHAQTRDQEANLIENICRGDLHHADVCGAVVKLVAPCKEDASAEDKKAVEDRKKELAKKLGVSLSSIKNYVRVGQSSAFYRWQTDHQKGHWTPGLADMISFLSPDAGGVKGGPELAIERYKLMVEAHRERVAAKGLARDKGGDEEATEKGGGSSMKPRRSSSDLYEEMAKIAKLKRTWTEKDGTTKADAVNPATGRAPTKRDVERVLYAFEVIQWFQKKKGVDAPSAEFAAPEVEEVEE